MEISELFVNSDGKLVYIKKELVLFRTLKEFRLFLAAIKGLEDLIQSNKKKDGC